MKIIYIAGPYRASTYHEVQDNIYAARQAAAELLGRGWGYICPHANTGGMEQGFPHNLFLDMGLELMKRCDAVFVLRGWERSEGTKKEIHFAEAWKLPVFYEKDGYPSPGVAK